MSKQRPIANSYWISKIHSQYPEKRNIWRWILENQILGSYSFVESLNGNLYWKFLPNEVIPHLNHLILDEIWWKDVSKIELFEIKADIFERFFWKLFVIGILIEFNPYLINEMFNTILTAHTKRIVFQFSQEYFISSSDYDHNTTCETTLLNIVILFHNFSAQ